jgi:hypothetical protein
MGAPGPTLRQRAFYGCRRSGDISAPDQVCGLMIIALLGNFKMAIQLQLTNERASFRDVESHWTWTNALFGNCRRHRGTRRLPGWRLGTQEAWPYIRRPPSCLRRSRCSRSRRRLSPTPGPSIRGPFGWPSRLACCVRSFCSPLMRLPQLAASRRHGSRGDSGDSQPSQKIPAWTKKNPERRYMTSMARHGVRTTAPPRSPDAGER